MDGVKINVNKEDNPNPTPKKRKRAVRKTAAKEAETKSSVSENKKQKKKGVSLSKIKASKTTIVTNVVSVVLTALIVGGAIYAWQNKNSEQSIDSVRQEARNVRVDFEQRLEQLKSRLSGVESENQELKTSAEILAEQIKLLDGAKKEFSEPSLGLSFDYPAVFGEVSLEMSEGASGRKFEAKFSKNDKLVFGGVSQDFIPQATSSVVEFIDSQGYFQRGDNYYFQSYGQRSNDDYEIIPVKGIQSPAGVALIVDKNSFIASADDDGSPVNIGENIGAIVNLRGDEFFGIAFLNQDLAVLPMESYEKMLSTINVRTQ